jgi:undecaprenyl pyrophosphate phosphatase UppP
MELYDMSLKAKQIELKAQTLELNLQASKLTRIVCNWTKSILRIKQNNNFKVMEENRQLRVNALWMTVSKIPTAVISIKMLLKKKKNITKVVQKM